MKLTAIDIAHKTFARKLGGLDPAEVYTFLREISEELEKVTRERNNLKDSLREKELAIHEYRERDETLKKTITTAAHMSEKIRQDAERESKLIIHDAHQKGELIIRDARDSLKKIYQEISDLKRIRLQFENNLRAVVQSHMALIEQTYKVMPDPEMQRKPMEASTAPAAAPRPV